MIKRPRYIEKLVSYKDNGRVKIITGIRRCGKSYLLKELYASYLHLNGIDEKHFVYIALDDFDNSHLWNPVELNKYIRSLIVDNQMYYIVIDEIQNVFDIKNPIFTNGKILKAKTLVVASNIGSLTNPNTISNTFKSEEHLDISTQTIYSYLEELEDSYLISKVSRYDIRGRKHIGALFKYYFSYFLYVSASQNIYI